MRKKIIKKGVEGIDDNEIVMKNRGEFRQFKSLLTKEGRFKEVSGSQKGQQLIMDEALRIYPMVVDWINNKSGVLYRGDIKAYFVDEDIILRKVVECFLYMAGTIYSSDSKKKVSRHKNVESIRTKLMPELSFENAWRFIEIIISFSQYFESVTETSSEKGVFRSRIKYTCSLSEHILYEVATIAAQSFYPLPTEKLPIDWEFNGDDIVGGYDTYQFEMVRSGTRRIDYTKYDQKIFDTINYIQSVPWRVNEEVLTQVKNDLKHPKKDDYVKSDYPDSEGCMWELDFKDDNLIIDPKEKERVIAIRETYQESTSLYNAEISDYESAVGKYRYVKLALEVAEKYVGKTIYFPHNFDFRGRIYPITIGLSPQGSDSIKALLLYANSEPLSKRGLEWSWAYMASLYGDDKLEFSERVARGKELIDTDYKEADEPYQFLSHQLEMRKYLKDNSYEPSLRIHLDATCSGSQFSSSITGDLSGCMATNVIPTFGDDGKQVRQDAYMLIAQKSLDLCNDMLKEVDEETVPTISFFKGLLESNGRKICKTPVMVANYGGTAGGRTEILWNMFRELGVERKWINKKIASKFSKIIGDSITGVLNGGKAFETYIHKMNNLIARNNVPIEWITSDGFHVVHSKNKEMKPKKVSCKIPGARRETTIIKKQYSKNLSSVKMKSAISPNYIHSLDAELLRMVALGMRDCGIIDTDFIHDSFGAHPNHVDILLDLCKECFLELMQDDPLGRLHKQLVEQVADDKKSQKELSEINVPRLNGFTKELNLNSVLVSDWFFS